MSSWANAAVAGAVIANTAAATRILPMVMIHLQSRPRLQARNACIHRYSTAVKLNPTGMRRLATVHGMWRRSSCPNAAGADLISGGGLRPQPGTRAFLPASVRGAVDLPPCNLQQPPRPMPGPGLPVLRAWAPHFGWRRFAPADPGVSR